jgi:hypothetical protein
MIPINEWHSDRNMKRAGMYHSRMMMENIKGIGYKMLKETGFTDKEMNAFLAEVKPQYRNLDIQGYYRL